MNDKASYRTEKMTESERKKRAEIERKIGVPDPPVPNRAHTEMSTRNEKSRAEGKMKHRMDLE